MKRSNFNAPIVANASSETSSSKHTSTSTLLRTTRSVKRRVSTQLGKRIGRCLMVSTHGYSKDLARYSVAKTNNLVRAFKQMQASRALCHIRARTSIVSCARRSSKLKKTTAAPKWMGLLKLQLPRASAEF